jgi:hypothetical protein
MTTLAKTYGRVDSRAQSSGLSLSYNRFIKKLEFSYFGLISMAILIGSCLGSIATMQVFQNNAPMWQFILSLGFSMANLVACIGQAPTKWVVNLFALCILGNAALLVANIL